MIVALALLSMGFWAGLRATFAVFYVALLDEFSWSRGGAAGVQSVAYVIYIILAPLVGGLIDRFGPRRVIVPGILLLSIGLVLSSYTHRLVQFYFFYGMVAASGITFISITAYSPILANWFEKKRGVASGFAASGMGLGTFLLVPLTQYMISLWGWRNAFVALGAIVFLFLFPTTLFFLRYKPEELGLYPDGLDRRELAQERESNVIDPSWAGTEWTLPKAIRTGRYWALMAFSFLMVTGVYLMLMHSVRYLVDQGLNKLSASFILALVGIISLPSRIFWGWLSDQVGREKIFTSGTLFVSVAASSLILMDMTGKVEFAYLFGVSLGLGWGVCAPTFLSVSADLFQGRRFGLIYGVLEAVIGAGCAFGSWVAGFIFDQTESYRWAFLLAGSVSLLSAVFVWFAAPRKVRAPTSSARRKPFP